MADMKVTIKGSSDPELRSLIVRLEQEVRATRLLQDLLRMSTSRISSYDGYVPDSPISLSTPVEDLYHYGVSGMRWGVRKRSGGSSSSASPETKRNLVSRVFERPIKLHPKDSEDAASARVLKKKKPRELTTKELKELTNRMNLEKQFRELSKKPKKYEKAMKYADDFAKMTKTMDTLYKFYKGDTGAALLGKVGLAKKAGGPAAVAAVAGRTIPKATRKVGFV